MGSVGSQRLKEPGTAGRSVVTSFSFDSCPLEEEVAAGAARGRDGAARGAPILTDSEGPAPDDRYHAIYFAMLLAGVGFLLPYNSFITDVDYLHHKFPGTSIVFDMSLTYILVALVAVLLNNALVERLSLHTRITAGYLLALGPLLFISVCDVWLQLFSRDQAYAVNLAAVGTVAFGCTVQQSSFYGYTGMLPKRYTQGVMTGEREPRPGAGQQRVPEGQPGPRGDGRRAGSLHALRRASGARGAELALLPRPAAAPVRGGPRHLGRHAVHRRDLLHHAVPVPRPRVRDPPLRAGRVAAHPRHGRVQPLGLRGQDPGGTARGLAGHAPAGLLLPARGLHPALHPVRLPQRRARPAPPRLALRLLPAHGHQQRLLRQRAHDPGRRQGGAPAAGAGREHHDRVLHDGADAGLGRGLLHLQPHPGRPQQLPRGPRRQRLPPRRPLSRGHPARLRACGPGLLPCQCRHLPGPPAHHCGPGSRHGLGAST
ncbi:equilibrative nucleoside transporter 4 isoform X5 [Eptesicus fuscus]|uniref:equilibrative nucleoside transporter 4 isoform X5 n=1 Tax=Eptesicus fuscus TaxID=29078 RepID=UPI002403E69B|nr:equilibrative nucleoside transporter 4 isoform X5 [Eptesicus fuscus]